jgi:hypothetical protein
MNSPRRDYAQAPVPPVCRSFAVSLLGAVLLSATTLLAPACTSNVPGAPDGGSDPSGNGGSPTGEGSGGSPVDNGMGGNRGAGGGSVTSTGGKTGGGGAGGITTGAGGRAGVGGRTGAGGLTGAGGTMIVAPASCGSSTRNLNPFGCNLAWGRENPGGTLTGYPYLQTMSFWIGSEAQSNGTLNGCAGCTWLSKMVAPASNLIPAFYAYVIGFYGHANGLPDGNVNPSGPNLTTGGANLIRNNRDKIISMYGSYAQQAHAVWGTKPLIWLLEGDFIQYTGTTQANPLSYGELAQLAEDITCAIKANMPNAVVAINHSTWNANDATNSYWAALNNVNYDMVWTSGAGDANGFFATGTTATAYNGATATYAYVHKITGRTIFVDTSFGLSAAGDSWSDAGAANLNARIAAGVVAVNVTAPDGNYASNIASVGALSSTCAP